MCRGKGLEEARTLLLNQFSIQHTLGVQVKGTECTSTPYRETSTAAVKTWGLEGRPAQQKARRHGCGMER